MRANGTVASATSTQHNSRNRRGNCRPSGKFVSRLKIGRNNRRTQYVAHSSKRGHGNKYQQHGGISKVPSPIARITTQKRNVSCVAQSSRRITHFPRNEQETGGKTPTPQQSHCKRAHDTNEERDRINKKKPKRGRRPSNRRRHGTRRTSVYSRG